MPLFAVLGRACGRFGAKLWESQGWNLDSRSDPSLASQMRDSNPDGVPLAHYREHPGCGVRFHCRACARSFDAPLESVISMLRLRRLGGAETGVNAVGRLAFRPCRRCGATAWETRPAFAAGRYQDGVIPPALSLGVSGQ